MCAAVPSDWELLLRLLTRPYPSPLQLKGKVPRICPLIGIFAAKPRRCCPAGHGSRPDRRLGMVLGLCPAGHALVGCRHVALSASAFAYAKPALLENAFVGVCAQTLSSVGRV